VCRSYCTALASSLPLPLQRGIHRVGDQLLQSFLIDYIDRLPLAPIDAHHATRAEFLRLYLRSLSRSRSNSSIHALCVELSSLARVSNGGGAEAAAKATFDLADDLNAMPTFDLGDDLNAMLTLMTTRVAVASSRLRPELTALALQVLCVHFDFSTTSSSTSSATLGRILSEIPREWLRPNCASWLLLSSALNGGAAAADEGWLARYMPSMIDAHFARLAASGTATAADEARLSNAEEMKTSVSRTRRWCEMRM
jgi:hypothetical protein